MSYRSRNFVIAAAIAAPCAMATMAPAAIVFNDDGESVGHNTKPVPTIGSWATNSTTVTRAFGQTTPADKNGASTVTYTTPAGPDGGNNVMISNRGTPVTGRYNFGAFSTAAAVGDEISVSFDALTIGGPFTFGFTSVNDPNGLLSQGYRLSTLTYINGGTVGQQGTLTTGRSTTTTAALPDLSHTIGSWQHYELNYTVGETSYEIVAGNNSYTSSTFYGQSPGGVTALLTTVEGIYFQANGSGVIAYFDNVSVDLEIIPEPSMLAMAGFGAGLLGVRRRIRR